MKHGILLLAAFMLPTICLKAQTPKYLDDKVPVEERIEDALSRMTTHEKVKILHGQSKFTSAGVPRLGIRQLNMDDGPHGVRSELEWNSWNSAHWTNDSCVAFPSLTCLAATWNRDMATLYGNAISEEFAYRGKDVILGPGANIARTPLNGRAFEYMGEDPLLAGRMATAYIQAAQKNGVACCMKHFVLNDQETDRMSVNVNVSERAMRELYLKPFEMAARQGRVWSIMGSYNRWQNVHCSHNDALLNGILKREWDWDGCLVSDWNATHDTEQAAFGGLDIEMGTDHGKGPNGKPFTYDDYYLAQPFEQMITEGKAPMSVLDEKVRRVLRLIFRTAMNPHKVIGSLCSEAHYDVCRTIAEEGIVLLKNSPASAKGKGESLLPLTAEKLKALKASLQPNGKGLRLLVVGENATRSLTLGGGSSELKTLRDIAPLDAFKKTFSSCEAVASVSYAQGYVSGEARYGQVDTQDKATQQRLHDEAIAAARQADLIIYVGGMNKNHRQDCEGGDREDYNLSFGQNALISELAAIQPRTVVCLFGGNAYATPWLNKIPALLHCWYLGSESGTALAEVLTGQVCPSGKLPMTFARNQEDYPSMMFGQEGFPGINGQVTYKEDIYVGYRWFDLPAKAKTAFLKQQGASSINASALKASPVFPFGFGLSYTSFKYARPTIATTPDGWEITVEVTNTGTCEGKETVQLYVGQKDYIAAQRPQKELKDFAKTSLRPGETKPVTLHLNRNDLRQWSNTSHQWQLVPGLYQLFACASSVDVRGQLDIQVK